MEQRQKEQRTRTSFLLVPSIFCLAIFLAPFFAQAQTWSEWFRQKKTQQRYLVNQIAALQVYIGYAKKGYDIVGDGIHTVRDIKNGEFGLHSAFFGSLKTVSPYIRDNAKVAEIIAMQLAITKAFGAVRGNDLLGEGGHNYINDVRENVLAECTKDLEELVLVITSGKVEMTEDERIRRLDKIYETMRDRSAFTGHFTGQVNVLIAQKERENRQNENLKKIYGHEKND